MDLLKFGKMSYTLEKTEVSLKYSKPLCIKSNINNISLRRTEAVWRNVKEWPIVQ